MNMKDKETTFWEYLSENKIEIPIIQRDYAQGREGKEFIRKKFLGSLYAALTHQKPYQNVPLKLDFVYGTYDNKKIYPLDGQQRLTTLWLLHWYIALKVGKLKEAAPILRRFSYETRRSSREFFSNLTDPTKFEKYDIESDVMDFILKQTWFRSSWKNDPTIKACLTTIKGYHKEPKEGKGKFKSEIERKNKDVDGLIKLFKGKGINDYQSYWLELTSPNAPIIFYQLPLEKFGLTDDLYIKMNARGKELTFFENFKADLIGYMREKATDKSSGEHEAWERLLDHSTGIPISLDTDWTSIFWTNRYVEENQADNSKKKQPYIDEIFYAFINRVFWNKLITAKDTEEQYVLKIGKSQEYANITYNHLSERLDNKDNPIPEYKGLEDYKYLPTFDTKLEESLIIPIDFFIYLQGILNRYPQISGVINDLIKSSDFEFIPKYRKENDKITVTTFSMPQRVIFYGICKYLVEGDYDVESFKRWCRFLNNLTTGYNEDGLPQIRTLDIMRSAFSLIEEISDSHKVYIELANHSLLDKGSALNQRFNEEIVKSKQILTDDKSSLRIYNDATKQTWEEKIIEAEEFSFFRGTIRFLYQAENGEADWSLFDQKYERVKKIFKQEVQNNEIYNTRDYFLSCLSPEYNIENGKSDLLKSLLKRFDQNKLSEYNTLWWKYSVFNNRPSSWMYFLSNPALHKPVNDFLLENPLGLPHEICLATDWKHALYLLTQTNLLEFVMSVIPNSWIRNGYNGHYAIYPSAPGVFMDAYQRDNFLSEEDVIVDEEFIVPKINLYYKNNIRFHFMDYYFQWSQNNVVSMIDADGVKVKRSSFDNNNSDIANHFSFGTSDFSNEQIKEKVEQLIREYNNQV